MLANGGGMSLLILLPIRSLGSYPNTNLLELFAYLILPSSLTSPVTINKLYISESKNLMPISLCCSSLELFLIYYILVTKSVNVASSLNMYLYANAYVLEVSMHNGFMLISVENIDFISMIFSATSLAVFNVFYTS